MANWQLTLAPPQSSSVLLPSTETRSAAARLLNKQTHGPTIDRGVRVSVINGCIYRNPQKSLHAYLRPDDYIVRTEKYRASKGLFFRALDHVACSFLRMNAGNLMFPCCMSVSRLCGRGG